MSSKNASISAGEDSKPKRRNRKAASCSSFFLPLGNVERLLMRFLYRQSVQSAPLEVR